MKRRYTDNELKDKKFSCLRLKEPIRKVCNGVIRIFWKCECECGNIICRQERFIVNTKPNSILSCGCQHKGKLEQGNKSKRWRGCGELSSQYFNSIKPRAEKLGIIFDLTIEEAWTQFEKQSRKCALTNLPLEFSGLRQRRRGQEQTASLDRIDSSKGYTQDNIQWVHKDVNLMKNHFNQDYFVKMCQLIVSTTAK